MKNQEQLVQEEIRKLIAESCLYKDFPNATYNSFHKTLLKFYFGAIDVNIDYEKEIISLWNSKPVTTNPVKLYDLNEAVMEKVSYNNLEETLKGCLEKGEMQTRFYITMLFTYNNVSGELDDVLSA